MEANYKKSVAIFGLAIPMVIVGLLVTGIFYAKGRVDQAYQKKLRVYNQAKQINQQITGLQAKLATTAVNASAWKALFEGETRKSFTEHWKKSGRQFRAKEFQMESPSWKNKSAGFGQGKEGEASQVNLSFTATFRAMQIAMMEVETRLPQMQLDSLQLKPSKNGDCLDIQTTYTIWTPDTK